jgi:single-stranded DNA-binding protein
MVLLLPIFQSTVTVSGKPLMGKNTPKPKGSNVVAWGSLAEITKEYLEKISLVYVESPLQSRNWQKKEGQNQRSIGIVKCDLLFLNNQRKHDQLDCQEEIEDYPF